MAVKMDKLLICIHFLYLLLLSVHFALNKQFETPNVVRTEYRDLRARAEAEDSLCESSRGGGGGGGGGG